MNNPEYEQELQERLAKADKFSSRVSRFVVLAYIAIMIFVWKTELVGLLVKIGAELPSNA